MKHDAIRKGKSSKTVPTDKDKALRLHPQRWRYGYTVLMVLGMIILTTSPLFAQHTAFLSDTSGKVEVRLEGRAWQTAEPGIELPLGASISTGFRSSAVLEVGTAVLEVSQLTRMRLDELIEREGLLETELFLQVGRVRAEVRAQEGLQQEFRLKSPVTTAAVRGTSFEFDGETVRVFSGLVGLSNQFNQSSDVGGGEETSSDGDDPPPSGGDALEQTFTVQTSTNPTEEAPPALPPAPTTGSVTVSWEILGD